MFEPIGPPASSSIMIKLSTTIAPTAISAVYDVTDTFWFEGTSAEGVFALNVGGAQCPCFSPLTLDTVPPRQPPGSCLDAAGGVEQIALDGVYAFTVACANSAFQLPCTCTSVTGSATGNVPTTSLTADERTQCLGILRRSTLFSSCP